MEATRALSIYLQRRRFEWIQRGSVLLLSLLLLQSPVKCLSLMVLSTLMTHQKQGNSSQVPVSVHVQERISYFSKKQARELTTSSQPPSSHRLAIANRSSITRRKWIQALETTICCNSGLAEVGGCLDDNKECQNGALVAGGLSILCSIHVVCVVSANSLHMLSVDRIGGSRSV